MLILLNISSTSSIVRNFGNDLGRLGDINFSAGLSSTFFSLCKYLQNVRRDAKDRGKLDFYEVWTRVPLVVVYTIFGSSILDSGFKKILAKKGKFPELIKSDSQGNIAPIPTSKDLPVIAEKLSKANKTPLNSELETLIKQKSIITGVPYLFSVVAMGFLLSGVSRLWTQYRYNQQTKNAQNPQKPQADFIKTSPVFKGIIEG